MKTHGVIKQGYQVASGLGGDKRFPDGTLGLQKPYFKAGGLDLSDYFTGTLNVSISPLQFKLKKADYFFEDLVWLAGYPPENFSFVSVTIEYKEKHFKGWLYYPHPETKPEHFSNNSTMEIMAPRIQDIHYGDAVILSFDDDKIEVN